MPNNCWSAAIKLAMTQCLIPSRLSFRKAFFAAAVAMDQDQHNPQPQTLRTLYRTIFRSRHFSQFAHALVIEPMPNFDNTSVAVAADDSAMTGNTGNCTNLDGPSTRGTATDSAQSYATRAFSLRRTPQARWPRHSRVRQILSRVPRRHPKQSSADRCCLG